MGQGAGHDHQGKKKSLEELQREVIMKKVRNTGIVPWDVGT